jgi:putative methyltransferase (TIGR04325 family)
MQVDFCSRWLCRASALPFFFPVIRSFRDQALGQIALRAAIGNKRTFPSLKDAANAIGERTGGGHDNLDYNNLHLEISIHAEPSDYPVLFYLERLLPGTTRLLDFGGSVGNLFYCYKKYITFREDLIWTVFDLPGVVERGKSIGSQKGAQQIKFTHDMSEVDGCDIMLASGSAHYFDEPIAKYLPNLKMKPPHVIVNRSPFTEGDPFAVIQQGWSWQIPCKIHNRLEFIKAFEDVGYRLVDNWQAPEKSIVIPGYPDRSIKSYSGFYFQLKTPPRTSHARA